jgi:hypothetical protein
MSINSGTIGGFTLHGRSLRDKFATLVPILHPSVAPEGGNPSVMRRVVRDNFNVPRPFDFEEQERPTLIYEQPQITVTVKLGDLTGTQTLDNTPQLDFVSITGLSIQTAEIGTAANFSIKTAALETRIIQYTDVEDEVTVNILDFTVTQ